MKIRERSGRTRSARRGDATHDQLADRTLRGPTQLPDHSHLSATCVGYLVAPPGADGEVGPGLVGAAPVVEDGFCFGRLGALAAGGGVPPVPGGLNMPA